MALRKYTLLTRPIKMILSFPHRLAGFLGRYDGKSWSSSKDEIVFLKNPMEVLEDLYRYLNLEEAPGKDPCHKIWDHDSEILKSALSFYSRLEAESGIKENYSFWEKAFAERKNPAPDQLAEDLWKDCLASHEGFQLANEILKIIPKIGKISGFSKLGVDDHLNAIIPEKFSDPQSIHQLIKVLNPLPKAKSDEIVAPMGGMFYSREAPHLPQLMKVGDHFEAGQPLFIVEVMKMFNKISVPFSGKIVKNFMEDSDGKIIVKGQPIFKIQPDELIEEESEEKIFERRKKISLSLIA